MRELNALTQGILRATFEAGAYPAYMNDPVSMRDFLYVECCDYTWPEDPETSLRLFLQELLDQMELVGEPYLFSIQPPLVFEG